MENRSLTDAAPLVVSFASGFALGVLCLLMFPGSVNELIGAAMSPMAVSFLFFRARN
jgi:hypothetical protein